MAVFDSTEHLFRLFGEGFMRLFGRGKKRIQKNISAMEQNVTQNPKQSEKQNTTNKAFSKDGQTERMKLKDVDPALVNETINNMKVPGFVKGILRWGARTFGGLITIDADPQVRRRNSFSGEPESQNEVKEKSNSSASDKKTNEPAASNGKKRMTLKDVDPALVNEAINNLNVPKFVKSILRWGARTFGGLIPIDANQQIGRQSNASAASRLSLGADGGNNSREKSTAAESSLSDFVVPSKKTRQTAAQTERKTDFDFIVPSKKTKQAAPETERKIEHDFVVPKKETNEPVQSAPVNDGKKRMTLKDVDPALVNEAINNLKVPGFVKSILRWGAKTFGGMITIDTQWRGAGNRTLADDPDFQNIMRGRSTSRSNEKSAVAKQETTKEFAAVSEKTTTKSRGEIEREGILQKVSKLPNEKRLDGFKDQLIEIANANPEKADQVRAFLHQMDDKTFNSLAKGYKKGQNVRKMVSDAIKKNEQKKQAKMQSKSLNKKKVKQIEAKQRQNQSQGISL